MERHHAIEQFLFREAELLDAWSLEEWLRLFAPTATYLVPATAPAGVAAVKLSLIDDDYERLAGRVQRLLNRRAHASFPNPRTRHLVSNVRCEAGAEEALTEVRANFIIYSARNRETNVLMGEYRHTLRAVEDGEFRIERKIALLDMETLDPAGGKINFVI